MSTTTGQCHCGEIVFEFSGDPINTAYCYCHSCQTQTNSDKWFGLWVPQALFQFTKGEPKTYTRLGDSGKDMRQHFCGKCGTTLAVFVEVGGFYSVSATTLADHSNYRPNMLIYTAHAADWAQFPEGIPKFDILPPELSGET